MNLFTVVVRPELLGKEGAFAVKANIGCGFPASASTPSLRGWIPKDTSPVVKAILEHGNKIVAVTNMPELAFGITSENPAFGDVENPRKRGYVAGGSSGGSAAAVAINAVSFALGTDTGGSARIPAALCGVVGYRPTTKLYDTSAVLPISSTTDTIGVLARSVTTVQEVHRAVVPTYAPKVRPLTGVRVGVPHQYYSVLHADVSAVTGTALNMLRTAGIDLVDVDLPSDWEATVKGSFDIFSYEAYHLIPKYLEKQNAPVSFDKLCEMIEDPGVKKAVTGGKDVSDEMYQQCMQKVQVIRQYVDQYFETNDLQAFVVPTTILPALKRPSQENVQICGNEFSTFYAYVKNTVPQSIAGVPCISLPCGLSADGLPIGLEIVAPRGMDADLLDLAATIEGVFPKMQQLSFDDFRDTL